LCFLFFFFFFFFFLGGGGGGVGTIGKYRGLIGILFVKVRRLAVRRIRDFNFALLRKWCWKLLIDRDSLWYRVLLTRYGVEDGRVCDGGCTTSAWWQIISTMRSEEWFCGNVCCSLGDGKNTLFWTDEWVGGASFSVRFNRLYELSVVNSVSVFDMHLLGWGWRRRRGVGGVGCLRGKMS